MLRTIYAKAGEGKVYAAWAERHNISRRSKKCQQLSATYLKDHHQNCYLFCGELWKCN